MFTIKVSPKGSMDVTATAASKYSKSMTDGGYVLHYAPLDAAEEAPMRGMALYRGDVAYIENAMGNTIDKVEGWSPPPQYVTGSNIDTQPQDAGHAPYESHFHLDDTAYLADGSEVKISGVLFSEGKVHYYLEGNVKAWDSCDLFDGPTAQQSNLFTQRTEVQP